ncbi:MAG: alkaline phosphatase [Bacteroidales bacterium]|jgi:alkaline phosphatase|nr:alkaline phosphatase [Bacteroidales bacterium]
MSQNHGVTTSLRGFKILLFLVFLLEYSSPLLNAQQQRPSKNVIVMITDGTSTSMLSIARWYQYYQNPNHQALTIDSLLRGLVKTFSSDAPIGDSAPTTSCYMTGHPSQTGFVSTYPVATDHDLVPVDATKAYQPMVTLLEAAKYKYGMSTGIVVKCEFPHATPADCAAHTYDRGDYPVIAKQMVHNNLDVVIAGGAQYLSEENETYLKQNNYEVIKNDYEAFRKSSSSQLWALLAPINIPYRIDADREQVPSLGEMTQKALDILSKNDHGFFLMVEGSLVDWAAHDNDAKTAILEFLEFDKAVQVAFQFAVKEGNTTIVILPDHANSGISMGNSNSNGKYDRLSLESFFKPIENYRKSAWECAEELNKMSLADADILLKKYYDIQLTDGERQLLYKARNYKASPFPKEERSSLNLVRSLTKILYERTYFGFTTYGHTGDDVFFAGYHPQNDMPVGVFSNIELNHYLCKQLNLEEQLDSLTTKLYMPHQELFDDSYTVKTDSLAPDHFQLTVTKKRWKLVAHSYDNKVIINNKEIQLSSLVGYMKKNKTFYLPADVMNFHP